MEQVNSVEQVKTPSLFRKSIRGTWEGVLEKPFKTLDGLKRLLQINTYKVYSGQLVTTCNVCISDGDFVVHTMYQDFSKRLCVSDKRCTSKNIQDQHNECVKQLDQLEKEAIEFYKSK